MNKFDYQLLKPHKIKPNNPRFKWLEKDYPGFLHTIFMQGIHAGVYEMNKLYPFGFKVGYCFNSQNKQGNLELDWLWDLRDLTRVRNIFISQAKKNLNFFNKIYQHWQKDSAFNFKVYQQAEKIDFSSLDDKDLYHWYEKLYLANIKQGRTGYLADCFLTVGSEDWLSNFIKGRLPKKFNLPKTITILTAPTIASYTNKEAIDLFWLTKLITGNWSALSQFLNYLKKNKKAWSALTKHAAKYYWIGNNYFARILKPEDFAKKLYQQLLINQQNLAAVLSLNYKNKKKLLKKINDPWLTKVIKMSELMGHMQDYRKCALVRFSHFLAIIFIEMAKRTNLKLNDYYNLVFPEVKEIFLNKKINRQKITARIKENFTYGNPKGFVVYEGDYLKKFVNKKDFFPDLNNFVKIRGVSACAGLVKGRVKIVKDAHKISSLGKNTVLVTNNTTPEFVPLMKQAIAIVTEQGGITCHAAIVSRELGVPCIIGTKIATQVFKDGDLVEVDANRGIVRKLKS